MIWQNGARFWTNSIRRNRCVSVLLMNLYSSMKTDRKGSSTSVTVRGETSDLTNMCPKFAIHAEPGRWNKGCLGSGLLQVWMTLLKEELWKILWGGMSSLSKWKTQKIDPSQASVSRGKLLYGCRGYHCHITSSPTHNQACFIAWFKPHRLQRCWEGVLGTSHYWGAAGEPLGQDIRPHHLSHPAFPHIRAGKDP